MKIRRPYTCGRCPKLFQGFCTLFAKVMVAVHPACELGKRFINSADNARRRKISVKFPHEK